MKGPFSIGTGGGGLDSRAVGGRTVVGPQCFSDRYLANSSAVSFMLHVLPSSDFSAVEWTAYGFLSLLIQDHFVLAQGDCSVDVSSC